MNRKKGFTLAEILISIGVIGVVATLTIPALVKDVSKKTTGPSLAKFVNTFENGTAAVLFNQNINLLSESDRISTVEDEILRAMSSYVNLTEAGSEEGLYYNYTAYNTILNINGNHTEQMVGPTTGTCNNSLYYTSSGALICVEESFEAGASGGPYKGIVADVYVDINGSKRPNRAGVDVFAFYLDDTGKLIPFGSKAMKAVLPNGKTADDCPNDFKNASAQNLFACTGKYADAGWKS